MPESNANSWSSEDTLRVLIASDIHLGYLENDAIRGEDSFIAFEEVLSQAVEYDVDLILLGGDLFDQAKPSPSSMFKCTQIIRKYCLGDKPVSIELLSDQLQNFARTVNYEDPNLNVSYPILSIHGNHDDPVGQNSVSSLDILSITGLVNYFGKWTDYTNVRISPVLMQKGSTKLALYGLSHLKDQRLSRLYRDGNVEMERVDETNDWFNLFVLHQNRADRGHGNYIPESVLPKFLDLVVWGHEHDCQVFEMNGTKQENDIQRVLQPGSTVATSLAAGEALPKHTALLQLHKSEFVITPLPLKTVRPFIFKTIVLSDENLGNEDINENEKVQTFLKEKVQEALEEAAQKLSKDPKQPTAPLVRFNVFYERDSQDFNRVRFGQNFNGLVANPNDILNMKREKKVREKKEVLEEADVDMAEAAVAAPDVEALLHNYFRALPPARRLSVLSVRAVTDALRDFTLRHDEDVFRRTFDAHRRRAVAALLAAGADADADVAAALAAAKAELDAADDDALKTLVDTSVRSKPAPKPVVVLSAVPPAAPRSVVVLSSDDDEPVLPARGRGRGARGARGAAGARGRGRARRAEPEPAPEPERRTPQPERRTPRRAAAQKSNSWLQNLANERTKARRGGRDSDDIDYSD